MKRVFLTAKKYNAMNKIKYSIVFASLAFMGASMACAADYVYGSTQTDNRQMNSNNCWFEIDDLANFVDYSALSRVAASGNFVPTEFDNLLIKSMRFDANANPYSTAEAGVNVIALRDQSFGFPGLETSQKYEVNNITISVEQGYQLNAGVADRQHFHWRVGNGASVAEGKKADGQLIVHGLFTIENSSKLTIQGNQEGGQNYQWSLIDINQLSLTRNGSVAGSKSNLTFSDHIQEIRIGVAKDGLGNYSAKAGTSIIGAGTSLLTALQPASGGNLYLGNVTSEAGSEIHLKGVQAKFVGDVVFDGTTIVLHNADTTMTGNVTSNGEFDFRLGSYLSGTFTNNGTLNMHVGSNEGATLSFNGKLVNTGTVHFGKGTFNGTIENSGTINFKRGASAEQLSLAVAKMTADVINSKNFLVSTDVEFKGSIQANAGSTTNFSGNSKGDFTGKTLFLNKAIIGIEESAKITLNGTTLKYNLELSGVHSTLELDSAANIDDLSSIFATDFAFMNIEEGEYDLIKFWGSSMFSSLADLLDETFEYIDLATHDLYEATFFSNTTGVFSVSFTLIPEPSTYAAIFGLFALAFAIYRRRK